MIKFCQDPVSYTHLDVYKRQRPVRRGTVQPCSDPARAVGHGLPAGGAAHGGAFHPHRRSGHPRPDVYKRQAQGKGLRIQPTVQTQAEPAVQTLTVTPPQLTLPCRAAILIDQTSGTVLYEMNACLLYTSRCV